jgi:hypothetical protein
VKPVPKITRQTKIQRENVAMLARDHGSTGKIINAHEAQLFHTPIGA